MEQEFNKPRTLDHIAGLLDGPLEKLGVADKFQDLWDILSTPHLAQPVEGRPYSSPETVERHFKRALNAVTNSLLGAAKNGHGFMGPGEGNSLDWIAGNIKGGERLVKNFGDIAEPLAVAGYHHSIGTSWDEAARTAVEFQKHREQKRAAYEAGLAPAAPR